MAPRPNRKEAPYVPHAGNKSFNTVTKLTGDLQQVSADLISGWALDRDRPAAVLELRILVDGRWIATIPTNVGRWDVEEMFPNAKAAGFEFAVPPYLCDGKMHAVTICETESGEVMPRCPFVQEFPSRPPEANSDSSLNAECPVLSDIGGLAASMVETPTETVPHIWLDTRYALQPVDPIGSDAGAKYRPFLPYIASFPDRFVNVVHGTIFNGHGDLWIGSNYLRDSDRYVADQALIRTGNPNIPRHRNVVVFATSGRGNYFHWHLDCLVNLYFVSQNGGMNNAEVVGPPLNAWQRDSLTLLGLRRYLAADGLIHANRIVTSSHTDGRGIFPDEHVKAMFSHLRSQFAADSATSGLPRAERLFISRADASTRVLENENELWATLETRGFRRIVPSEHSYIEQVALFSAARTIVATHGAGMTNIGYAEPGADIYEIRHASYPNPCFEHLSLLLGHRHHDHIIGGNDPYRLDIPNFLGRLDRMMADG